MTEPRTWPAPLYRRTVAHSALQRHAEERDALLARIVRALELDTRVAAARLSGSFGRGEADEWADYDLHIAVEDAHVSEYLAERRQLYARVGDPILIQADMASNSLPGGRYQLVLFAGSHQVDWNIGPRGQALRPLAFQMLLARAEIPVVAPPLLSASDRRAKADTWLTFFWAMAPIAIAYAGRTETERAVEQIRLLATACIALQRLALAAEPTDPWLTHLNRVLEPEIERNLPRLGPRIDAQHALDVIRALCAEVEQLHPALAALGVVVPARVPAELHRLGALAAEVVQLGPQLRRTYR